MRVFLGIAGTAVAAILAMIGRIRRIFAIAVQVHCLRWLVAAQSPVRTRCIAAKSPVRTRHIAASAVQVHYWQ